MFRSTIEQSAKSCFRKEQSWETQTCNVLSKTVQTYCDLSAKSLSHCSVTKDSLFLFRINDL